MNNFYLIAAMIVLPFFCFGQLNVAYVGQLDYDQRINDIWGYATPDGSEYALVGTNTGFSIVSLADPANPQELFFIEGTQTTWRDIKTWETYAYVVCDNCLDGLLVVDLSDLPNSIEHQFIREFDNGTLGSSHNIFIDEFGYAYMSGTDIVDVFFLDCFTDPYNPKFVANSPTPYAHDIYTRNNLMYASEIYNGHFAIYDVSDKNNVSLLGTQSTQLLFTHNAWLSDDSNYLFTTDERPDAPVGSYDVSDPTDIKELDQFLSLETRGIGTVPHNVHVYNDFLIVSYYTDGCIIVDASRPENLIEVGNFDTYIPGSVGYSGSWGAYPFLPSGKILVTDRDNGLYVLQPNYKRAAFLEGKITNAQSGAPIEGATVRIVEFERDEYSNSFGDYKSGIPDYGTFNIEITKPLFESQTIEVSLVESEITVLDVALEPLMPFALNVKVIDKATGASVPFSKVRVVNEVVDIQGDTDSEGIFTIDEFYAYDTDFHAGEWGYKPGYLRQGVSLNATDVVLELEKGYQDNFAVDLGWTSGGVFNSGAWELGVPSQYLLTYSDLELDIIPAKDVPEDPGNFAYLTGIADPDLLGNIFGIVDLKSPMMQMSTWAEPSVSFYYWYFNLTNPDIFGFPEPGASTFEVYVSNGIQEVKMDEKKIEVLESLKWEFLEYKLSDFIQITDQMQIIIRVRAEGGQDITEGLVDFFNAWDANPSSTLGLENSNGLLIYPNPSKDDLVLVVDESYVNANYEITNILGMSIQSGNLSSVKKKIDVSGLQAGAYIVSLKDAKGKDLISKKFIKQ